MLFPLGCDETEIARGKDSADQELPATHVFDKLGVSSRTEAVAVALRRGLLPEESSRRR